MTLSGRFMIHNTGGGGQQELSELTRWQQLVHPLFHFSHLDAKTGRDDTTLVKSTIEMNDDFSIAMVIDDFELINVAMLLHGREELDGHLGRGSYQDLSLATSLCIVDGLEGVVKNADANHGGG